MERQANPWDNDPIVTPAGAPAAGGAPRPLFTAPPKAPEPLEVARYNLQVQSSDRADAASRRAEIRDQRAALRDERKVAQGDKLTEGESKATNFLISALGAEREWRTIPQVSTMPTLGGDAARAILPAGIVNSNTSPERQRAQQAKENFIRASLRLESGAAIGAEEFDRQDRIFFPQAGDSQATIDQKSRSREQVIDGFRIGAGPGVKQVPNPTLEPMQKPVAQAEGAEIKASADGSASFSTEQDKRYATDAQALLDKPGTTRDDFNRLALQYGSAPFGPELDAAIQYRNGGGKGARVTTPTSGASGPSVIGAMAASPVGAAVTGVANTLTAGGLDDIVGATGGDQQQAELAKTVMAADHPYAYMGGELAGTIAGSLGAGGLAARALPALGAGGASLVGDVAYGAASGAGENNDNRLGGALVGGAVGAGGNLAGQALVRGVSGVLAPKLSDDIRFLRDKGVRLTPGQALGPAASRAEEKLISLPIVGNLIGDARRGALDDFNAGVMNDALGKINAKVPAGVRDVAAMRHGQKAFDDAYADARANMQLVPDAQMATDLTDLSNRVAGGQISDEAASRLGKIYDSEVLRRMSGPVVDGDTYKTMSSRLGALARSTRAKDPELSTAIGEMQGVIDGAARRSSPPEAAAKLDAADEGYALWVRVENAARRRGGDTGTFTPAQLDSAVQAGDGSVRSRSYLRGDALGQDWSDAGKGILRDQVPNSGTVDRLATGSALAGMATLLTPKALIPAGALATAYLPGIRGALAQAVLAERPAAVSAAAGALRDRSYLAGTVGTAGALEAFGRR